MKVKAPVESKVMENGIRIQDLAPGAVIEVKTLNRTYKLENRGAGQLLISGHPEYCPEPVLVELAGATPFYTPRVLGAGMCLWYQHPRHGRIRTSSVELVREVALPERCQ